MIHLAVKPEGQQSASLECCMCGDCGLSYELFQCKICQFRSQHRYCSSLYPKAKSYQACNWCLSHESKDKSQNSCNSSSFNKSSSEEMMKRGADRKEKGGFLKTQRRDNSLLQVINSSIKKQRSPETSPRTPRRRVVSNGRLEEMKLVRRTKSEEISNNNGITKQVFRNKVRRYKLLHEVSC